MSAAQVVVLWLVALVAIYVAAVVLIAWDIHRTYSRRDRNGDSR